MNPNSIRACLRAIGLDARIIAPNQSPTNDPSWSNAGARFGEMVATRLTIEPWLRMAGMEQAERKRLLPLCASCRPPNR